MNSKLYAVTGVCAEQSQNKIKKAKARQRKQIAEEKTHQDNPISMIGAEEYCSMIHHKGNVLRPAAWEVTKVESKGVVM